jgi:hypothetical protein
MKTYFSFILLLTVSGIFSACRKAPKDHTITFKYHLLDFSKYGNVQNISVGVRPYYSERENTPTIKSSYVNTWEYNYIGLNDGNNVFYEIQIPLSIYYEMSIFIDGKEVSYRRIKTSDSNYYSGYIAESRGIDTLTGFHYLPGAISFTFHE